MDAILVQPRTSLTGALVRMVPLGLLYASSAAIKSGHGIRILDCRIRPGAWEEDLRSMMTPATCVVGVSTMSGYSIIESLSITRFVKNNFPGVSVVWGGPHVTFSPDEIMAEPSIDFLIRGYGAEPFRLLLDALQEGAGADLTLIQGLSWRDAAGRVRHNVSDPSFEHIDYRDIPYDLIDDYSVYFHPDNNEVVFPMYSVMGCPYNCAFCSSPAQYARLDKKWLPYPVEEVVGHIRLVHERYGATLIYFIDEDSFVDLGHVAALIDGLEQAGVKVKLGFRGARINEILAMSDQFLDKLVSAGTRTIHVGVESGSDRILDLMNKKVTVHQIIEANRKLARHPEILALYNFIVGYPTETVEETLRTRDLILQLIAENPRCIVIPLNKPRPLAQTALMELALQHGYLPPQTLEEWGNYDVESSDYRPVWLSREHDRFIRMMFLCMYFIDDKLFKLAAPGGGLGQRLLKLLARLYKPIAMLRFRYGIHQFLLEDAVYSLLKRLYR